MSSAELSFQQVGVIVGTILASAFAGLGAFWAAYRRVRAQLREDGASEKTASKYQDIISQMESQIARLESRLTASEKRTSDLEERLATVSQRYAGEIEARMDAVRDARDAKLTIVALQHRIEIGEKNEEILRSRVAALEQELHEFKRGSATPAAAPVAVPAPVEVVVVNEEPIPVKGIE